MRRSLRVSLPAVCVIVFSAWAGPAWAGWVDVSSRLPGGGGSLESAAAPAYGTAWVLDSAPQGPLFRTQDGGSTWQRLPIPSAVPMFGVSFPQPGHGYLVGSSGGAIRYSGSAFTGMTGAPAGVLWATDFVDTDIGWAVSEDLGGPGVYRTTDGAASWSTNLWRAIPGSGATSIDGVDAVSSQDCWVAGNDGLIARTIDGGSSWRSGRISLGGVPVRLWDVSAVGSRAWAVGSSGVVVRTTDGGVTWSRQTVPVTGVAFRGVHFPTASRGWVVGDKGTILYTNDGGAHWYRQPSGTTVMLQDVAFFDPNAGWVVGRGGTVLRTTDAGGGIPVPSRWSVRFAFAKRTARLGTWVRFSGSVRPGTRANGRRVAIQVYDRGRWRTMGTIGPLGPTGAFAGRVKRTGYRSTGRYRAYMRSGAGMRHGVSPVRSIRWYR